ncbi:MAG: replication initiation protein [Cetobacterium somerae]|uniref:replication initiation protein n=1 Tax=Cetobacterium somerae TaxID=188913 RepID=UPI003F2DBBE3
MNKKDTIIYPKRNELSTLKGNTLSLNARKIYDFIYRKGIEFYKNHNNNFGIYELNIYEIKQKIGMNKTTDHSMIIKELELIRNVEFKTYDDKYFLSFPILAGFNLKADGTLEVALSQFLIRMILEKKEPYYHFVDELAYKPLKSKYSKIILDLYFRYKSNKNGIPEMNINKFQDTMQYTSGYKNNDIERFVLGQAQKELENYNNLILTWEIEKVGRKWANIKLNIKEKSIIDTASKINISANLLKAIEKSRKNRFIESSYSQKAMEKILQKYNEKDIIKALGELYKYNSEIKNFSKILTSKIEDIKNSKMSKINENQGYILGQEEVETPLKTNIIESKKSDLDIEKEKVSNLIRKSKLPTNQRLFFLGQLNNIETFESLENFKKIIEGQIALV